MRSASNAAPAGTTVPIPPVPDGWQSLTYAVLRDGKLAILGTDVDLRRELRRNEQGMPAGDPEGAAARAGARIWTFDGVTLVPEVAFPLLWPSPCFDKFPDGRWLVTNALAQQEPMGRILTREGRETNRIQLGYGIEHLKIDDSGLIWVGWFDQASLGTMAGAFRVTNGHQAAMASPPSMVKELWSGMRRAGQRTALSAAMP